MCFGCTSPFAWVKPTPRALSLGQLLFYMMFILFVIMILSFWVDATLGLFGIILVITGLCAVRDSEYYNIEQILCVILFSGYLWVIALVDLIIYLVSQNSVGIIQLIALFGGLIFYAASLIVSKKLYDELRLNYVPRPPEELMGPFGFPPLGRRSAQPQPFDNQGQIPPSTQPSKFQKFAGEGHRLNE